MYVVEGSNFLIGRVFSKHSVMEMNKTKEIFTSQTIKYALKMNFLMSNLLLTL